MSLRFRSEVRVGFNSGCSGCSIVFVADIMLLSLVVG
jgi:hypothetical protein